MTSGEEVCVWSRLRVAGPALVALALGVTGCGGPEGPSDAGPDANASRDAAPDSSASEAGARDADPPASDAGAMDGSPGDDAGEGVDAAAETDAGAASPCATRITYGVSWIRPSGHPADYDDVSGAVSWDGRCVDDGASSYAELSNGWRPYFAGRGACVIALDARGDCAEVPVGCQTRVTYGAAWAHPAGHPAQYDDVDGVVSWAGECEDVGARSRATLSNGWQPHFDGSDRCAFSFRYRQCGGLYANPVIDQDCPDPGVSATDDGYVLTCTGGRFRIFTSPDLVHWTRRGSVFASPPRWAVDRFWAPEIHEVSPGRWVAYFSAGRADGALAVGAATATDPLGPYEDIGAPLVHDPRPGVIDAHYFRASDGRRFLTWKLDGNAIGQPTPIRIQRLAADGVTLMGSPQTILENDRAWENHVVEGQWIIERGGFFYLFYSGNAYDRAAYAVGVARASSPTGPYEKAPAPILTTNAAWAGPGHGSVVRAPGGEWVFVYHAWVGGRAGESPGRQVLVDRITWSGGWPRMLGGPSSDSLPPP